MFEKYKIGYIMRTNGYREPIKYIAENNGIYIRVFTQSGEYLAYTKGNKVWRHMVNYVPTPSLCGDYLIEDYSQWYVADDIYYIVTTTEIT